MRLYRWLPRDEMRDMPNNLNIQGGIDIDTNATEGVFFTDDPIRSVWAEVEKAALMSIDIPTEVAELYEWGDDRSYDPLDRFFTIPPSIVLTHFSTMRLIPIRPVPR